jgi:hydrogenase expression/formation protein HypD
MGIKHLEEYRDPGISRRLSERIRGLSKKSARLMEVCGTHTMSIFRHGIHSLLPPTLSLISGPGCPVCVTSQGEIDASIALARMKGVIVTTFGDLMRVPGSDSSLQKERARGREIHVVYSTFDALEIARKNPGSKVVFLGVGFETTAPTIAASILAARSMGLDNYTVFSAHKLVPPALKGLMRMEGMAIDGLILPGHVSVIIGTQAYAFLKEELRMPSAVAGFEPVDILQAIHSLVSQIEGGTAAVDNCYSRAVSFDGNRKAQKAMAEVFEETDAVWRGLGSLPMSGLRLREEFSAHDAVKVLGIRVNESEEPRGCSCGEILTGRKTPPQCALYARLCTPADPVGPCMVSSEGTCAAFYKYSKAL